MMLRISTTSTVTHAKGKPTVLLHTVKAIASNNYSQLLVTEIKGITSMLNSLKDKFLIKEGCIK